MKINKKIGIVLVSICLFMLMGCTDDKSTETVYTDVYLETETEELTFEEPIQQPNTVNIKAIGDVMLGRGVGGRLNGDYIYPFLKVRDILQSADITFANLESSISTRGEKLIEKGYWLRAHPKAVEGIKYAGLDIVNIANNHILDFTEIAMMDTIEILDSNNIKHIGAGANLSEARTPIVFEVNKIKIGFLGYSDFYQYGFGKPRGKGYRYFEAKEDISGVAPLKFELIEEDIKKLREEVDLIVISLHWGIEESHHVPEDQRELAHSIMDAGADMILGHHPHQLQGIEIYNGKAIVYSMGNFIFDQNDKENNETMIVDVDFTDGKITKLEVIPLKIRGKTQTVLAEGKDATHILGYLHKFSEKLDTKATIEDNRLIYKIK